MHGCGNDFVIIDGRSFPLDLTPEQAAAIADRHTGVGCDQLIVLHPAAAGADVFMRIWNPDGSQAGACGNATRCVAAILFGESRARTVTIRTVSGDLPARHLPSGQVEVDMGPVRLDWQDIPLAQPADTLCLKLSADGVAGPAAASMGNPHATFFVPDLDAIDLPRVGPALEHAAMFPQRANVGFAQILDAETIRLRVWERGAGLTLACGSGACAALVNANRRALTHRRARVILDGGTLQIEWRDDGHVLMTGPATTAFTGAIDLDAVPV